MISNNLIVIITGGIFIVFGILIISLNKGFAYSMMVFGLILIVITLIKILWEKGKL